MKQVARFVIGNPGQSDFNTIDIIKSSENSPIVSFHEFGDSGIDYDYAGNIFYKNINKIISDIKEIKSNIVTKTEVIEKDFNLDVGNLLIGIEKELSILTNSLNVQCEKYNISAEKYELSANEIILGNSSNVEFKAETKDTDYDGDFVLTLIKYIRFYRYQLVPFLLKIVEVFDRHKHIDPISGTTDGPIPADKISVAGKTELEEAQKYEKLKSSTSVKAI